MLAEGEWAIRVRPGVGAPLHLVGPSRQVGEDRVFVYARHAVMLSPGDAARLLRALEDVKPDELDAKGRQLAWAPVLASHGFATLALASQEVDNGPSASLAPSAGRST